MACGEIISMRFPNVRSLLSHTVFSPHFLQIRSVMKSKEECLVDAENLSEIRDCEEPIREPHFILTESIAEDFSSPVLGFSKSTVAAIAPTPAFDEMIDAEECIVYAESRAEQLDCATRPKAASLNSPNPASYPSMRRSLMAGLRERFGRRLGAVQDTFPSPWFPATIASTLAVGRAIARW